MLQCFHYGASTATEEKKLFAQQYPVFIISCILSFGEMQRKVCGKQVSLSIRIRHILHEGLHSLYINTNTIELLMLAENGSE